MKVCIIQPEYSLDHGKSEEFLRWELEALDACDDSMDLIVLPESADTPCLASTQAQRLESYERFNAVLMEKAVQTARRCNAILVFNARSPEPAGLRNTTFVLDRQGQVAGKYFKEHLTPGECRMPELDHSYSYEPTEPTILELEGVRYAFLVCYDAYFYENFANIARYDPDVILACSHQRSDTHEALRIMHRFLAYNTNAWVIRASVSMGENAGVGGTSMVVAPDGTVLADLEGRVGMACAEIEPHRRYLKPAGFGNADACHHHYVETGRRPWKYRNGGAAIAPYEEIMDYPRICAHRGFNTVLPENSMPAWASAIALGAQEIEFDLWPTKDRRIVSIHDKQLDRVSDGEGFVWEYTYEELLRFDFGIKRGEAFQGMRIPTLEEILKRFAGQVIMNIHVKDHDECPVTEELILEIARLLQKYDCERHCYFMSGTPYVLEIMAKAAPQIPRCAGGSKPEYDIVDKALDYGCGKVQLFKPNFHLFPPDYVEATCRRAHAFGIKVNIFYSDDPEEARRFLEAGCDTILTNDYNRVSQILK